MQTTIINKPGNVVIRLTKLSQVTAQPPPWSQLMGQQTQRSEVKHVDVTPLRMQLRL
jgi:hypothetical protein